MTVKVVVEFKTTMKHKFKPSIGGSRGKKGAVGGGRKDEQTLHSEKPAAPTVEHLADDGPEMTQTVPPQSATTTPATTNQSTGAMCSSWSSVVPEASAEDGQQGGRREVEAEGGQQGGRREVEAEDGQQGGRREAEAEDGQQGGRREAEAEDGQQGGRGETEAEDGQQGGRGETDAEGGQQGGRRETEAEGGRQGGRGETDAEGGAVERREAEQETPAEKSQPSLSRGKLSSLATNSVRLKKKVVPTLISNRPRRPKLDRPDGSKLDRPDGSKLDRPDGSKPDRPDGSKPDRPDGSKSDRPDGSKPDRPDGSKPDRPAVELVAQGSTHVDHNDRSSAQNPPSSHTAVRPVAESNESQVSVSHPAAHYSHTLGRRNNLEEEARREEVISDALSEVLEREIAHEDSHDSCSSTHDGNLSGVVRSSLDLLCPPPTRDEGATFETSREERRPTGACASSGEEETQESGVRTLSVEGDPEGGKEGEGEQPANISRVEVDEDRDGEDTRENLKTTKTRKRQSSSGTASADSTAQRTKRRKVTTAAAAGVSHSPNKLRKAPDRTSMTMRELIYYNPSANPMSSTVEEKRRKVQQTGADSEQEKSEPSSRAVTPAPPGSDVGSEVSSEAGGECRDDGRIVPQLRVGKDGNIILDEGSMVVQSTAKPLAFDDALNPPLIEGSGHTTSASYRKSSRVTRWTREETTQFYRALSQVGTDFTMMTLLLSKRTRKELKNKFKKEEKSNPHRISLALKNQISVRPAEPMMTGGAVEAST